MITLTIVTVMRLLEHHKVFAMVQWTPTPPLYSLDLFTTKGIEHYRKTIKVAKQNYALVKMHNLYQIMKNKVYNK